MGNIESIMIDSIKNNNLTEDQKNKIFSVFLVNEFGVVSTYPINSQQPPETAVVAISHAEDFCLVFGSFSTSRKNILSVIEISENLKKGKGVKIDKYKHPTRVFTLFNHFRTNFAPACLK